MIWKIISTLGFLLFVAGEVEEDTVEQVFLRNALAPGLVKVPPTEFIDIYYKSSRKEVNLGNDLTPAETREVPAVAYKADENANYTLIMVDPDAPSRSNQISADWVHWVVVNIPGSKIWHGEHLIEYVGPVPLLYTGYHRYTFLLFEQPKRIKFCEKGISNRNGKRNSFLTRDFVKRYNLGNPVAGNFFLAEFDSSVPSSRKYLGLSRLY